MLSFLTHFRALARFIIFVTALLIGFPFQFIWLLIFASFGRFPAKQSPFVRIWHHAMLRMMGIDVTIVNKRNLNRKQKIYLSNHISYLDIIIYGAMLDCFFVAKNDIIDWPVFGFLSKLCGTIFISRKRTQIKKQIDLTRHHLDAGQSILIFAEGTTGNGREVLPFKGGLLNVLDQATDVKVQPVTIAYTHLNNKKIKTEAQFDTVAWYGDMTLAPHLWHMFRQRSIKARIIVQPAMECDGLSSKEIAMLAQKQVADNFNSVIH